MMKELHEYEEKGKADLQTLEVCECNSEES